MCAVNTHRGRRPPRPGSSINRFPAQSRCSRNFGRRRTNSWIYPATNLSAKGAVGVEHNDCRIFMGKELYRDAPGLPLANYPFKPPLLNPATKSFCKIKNNATAGSTPTSVAAISNP